MGDGNVEDAGILGHLSIFQTTYLTHLHEGNSSGGKIIGKKRYLSDYQTLISPILLIHSSKQTERMKQSIYSMRLGGNGEQQVPCLLIGIPKGWLYISLRTSANTRGNK